MPLQEARPEAVPINLAGGRFLFIWIWQNGNEISHLLHGAGIFIYKVIFGANVGKYSIPGAFGYMTHLTCATIHA